MSDLLDAIRLEPSLMIRLDLPPRMLSPNQRYSHWRARNGPSNNYKAYVTAHTLNAVREAGWQAPHLARLSMRWCLLDKRSRAAALQDPRYKPEDPDNAIGASKALIDGLKEGGAIMDDTWDHLEIGRIHSTKEAGLFVEITVESVVGAARLL